MNKIMISGNFTKEPEMFTVRDKYKLCKFTLAGDVWANGRIVPIFYECSAWEGKAEHIMNYAKKGTQAVVFGRLTMNTYKNKDGVEITKYTIDVEDISLIAKRKKMKIDDNEFSAIMEDIDSDSESEDNDLPF